MQLTGPLFFLFFLPLTWLLLIPLPKGARRVSFPLLSLLYLLLAFRDNLFGGAVILALVLLSYLLLLPRGKAGRVALLFTVALSLGTLFYCRIGAFYGFLPFPYPYGLTFAALAAISARVEVSREKIARPGPLAYFGYLCCFPLLTVGPVLTADTFFSLTEAPRPSLRDFSRGARIYLFGMLQRLAVSAVAFSSLLDILAAGGLPYVTLPLLLILLLVSFLTFLSGSSYMARGILSMYGICLLPDFRPQLSRPHKIFSGLLLSLTAYLRRYLAPLGGKWLPLLTAVFTVFFFANGPAALLLSLPLLLFTLLPAPQRKWHARLRGILVFLSLGIFACGLAFPYLHGAFSGVLGDTYVFFTLLRGFHDLRYLLCLLLLSPFLLFWLGRRSLYLRRLGGKAVIPEAIETLLLFAAFFVTFLYLLPRFPQIADKPSLWLFL